MKKHIAILVCAATLLPQACASKTVTHSSLQPSVESALIVADFIKTDANPFNHIASVDGGEGYLVPIDEAFTISCELGDDLYIYLKDVGSGICIWRGNIYRKDDKGNWKLHTRVHFSSLGNIVATRNGAVLTISSGDGKRHFYTLDLSEAATH